MFKKRIYSKPNYCEARKCDNCQVDSTWNKLVTVKMEPIDEWLYGKKFLHLCPECYIGLKDHKYVKGEIK